MNKQVGIRFEGAAKFADETLFPHISFKIPAGEWTCLLGPSGVGKSTVLRLIASLDTAVEFDGIITSDDHASIDDRISYMAQSDLLFPWLTVWDNVNIGARLRGDTPDQDRARRMIERTGLTNHTHKKPAALSGGQRQRVALARTLMEDRPIVLLDEPFSALDAKTRADMQELAAELLTGRTVLLVTHDPAEAARLAHSGYVMQPDGLLKMDMPNTIPVRAIDAPETLETQSALFRVLRGGAI
jgi:putative hydroxymethylpyrimidine transport system ATP-binding protein